MKSFTPVVLLGLACALGLPLGAQPDRVNGRAFATRSEIIAQHGMAATSHPLATQVALDILKAGGSAVDAAIAANAALGLMEPTGNGIGGDLFAIVWSAADKKLTGLNASGRSPLGLSREQLMADLKKLGRETIPMRGLLPISVPGAVDGWFALHGRFGKLPMADLLQPTIDYARNGNALPRPAMYQAYHQIVPLQPRDEEPEVWEVVGPICESGDWLGHDRNLAPRQGDLLAVLSAGAYCMSMASNYNSRGRAPEVLVDGGQTHLIRRRETIGEQMQQEQLVGG